MEAISIPPAIAAAVSGAGEGGAEENGGGAKQREGGYEESEGVDGFEEVIML